MHSTSYAGRAESGSPRGALTRLLANFVCYESALRLGEHPQSVQVPPSTCLENSMLLVGAKSGMTNALLGGNWLFRALHPPQKVIPDDGAGSGC